MRKNELIHLHSLLRLLKRHFEEKEWFDDEAFAEYESLDVAPAHVHKPKERHERAVITLATAIANELAARGEYGDGAPPEPVAANGW